MNEIDAKIIWAIFRRKWKFIVIAGVTGAVLCGIGSKLFITPKYRSSVSLYMGRMVTPEEKLSGHASRELNVNNELAVAYRALTVGASMAEDYLEVINMNAFDEDVRAELVKKNPEWMEAKFSVSCDKAKESRIVTINVLSNNPLFSQSVAQVYSDIFIRKIRDFVGLSNTQIIKPANLPKSPDSPKILLNALLGGILLAGGYFSFLVFRRVLDRTIHNINEARKALQLPILGTIHRRPNSTGNSIFVSDTDLANHELHEDFRVMRVNLLNRSKQKENGDGTVIAVSSAGSMEGKTFCTANIGASLADAGYKVLMIDCDSGVRSLQSRLDDNSSDGLMDVLSEKTDFDQAVRRNIKNRKNMDALFCGKRDMDSSNLLLSSKFKKLIEKAKKDYDYTFLDVSCHMGAGDIMSVGGSADSVIMLVEAGKTGEDEARRTLDAFKTANMNVAGVVLNSVSDENK